MKLITYRAPQFASALKALLPPGKAWDWQAGSMGDALMQDMAQELARLNDEIPAVLDNAIETHRPAQANWHIDEYRRVANEAVLGKIDNLPRRYFGAGSRAGQRLWSAQNVGQEFTVPLVLVDHLVGPLSTSSHAGDACWSTRSRYILRVRYFRSVVNPKLIWDALTAFKQAHVVLWLEDITGVGGEVSYA